ncbi:MAG: hypothetical protein BGO68_04190 [Candidatus Amoebophilus sp. 36-38]|nr:MAG: hypothetical protein BGO68_04190 [Candidatus Amoebophilus sp. 36-38]
MHTYNTNQEPLRLKEYGRNVQRLVTQLERVENKTLRTQYAEAILKVMGILHSSNAKPTIEYLQKRWDDLFVISDYKLDINSPYPVPTKELSIKKPERLTYSKQPIKYRHCGRHIELLVKKAVEVTDPTKQAEMVMGIAKLIKSFSAIWNKDNLDMNAVMNIIQDLAEGKLIIDLEKLKSENNLATPSYSIPKEKKEQRKATHKKKKVSFATKAK